MKAGEVRRYLKKGLAEFWGELTILEVHDVPTVSWTNEPTCLVQRKNFHHHITQTSLEELTEPTGQFSQVLL